MNADITLTAAAIATLISAMTSAAITLWINRSNKKKNLDDQLDTLLKLALQYPYLESDHFTLSWTSGFDKSNEKYLRYDVYCNLLFNFIYRVAKHYKYNVKKIEDYVGMKHWIRTHCKNWQDPASKYENVDSYDKKFVDFINTYLK